MILSSLWWPLLENVGKMDVVDGAAQVVEGKAVADVPADARLG